MKKLLLKLNTEGIEKEDIIKNISDEQLTSNIIVNLVVAYSNQKNGLNFDNQRHFYKIGDKFEEAIKENKDEVILEDAWFKLIYDAMKQAKMPPNKLLNRVYDLIEDAEKTT